MPLRPEHIDQIDFEWLLLGAVRESLSIAHEREVSYIDTVAIAKEVAGPLIEEGSPLIESIQSDLHRLFRERASLRSNTERRKVEASEILEEEISRLNAEIASANDDEKTRNTRALVMRYANALVTLDESRWTETQAIRRDSDALRQVLPVSGNGQDYKDFSIGAEKRLRVRVLHPDPGEWQSGVDLIYEEYHSSGSKNNVQVYPDRVRVAALQYKMWDGVSLRTTDDDRIKGQMHKAAEAFCKAGMCHPPDPKMPYRLPCCSVFLRPTGRTQTRRGYHATRAWHVPICVASASFVPTTKGEKITAESIQSASVSQDVFLNLFNRHMLGSRWIPIDELEELYRGVNIFIDVPRVLVHAQQFGTR